VLSQAAIDRVTKELLEQVRSSRFGFTDPAGIPVPVLYQSPHLQRLPQGLQLEIVRKATLELGASPLFMLAVLAWIAAIALVYALEPTLLGRPLVPSAFMILAPLAPLLFRALLVRHAVRRIAAQLAASWPLPARL
jgi:hypothetical protein